MEGHLWSLFYLLLYLQFNSPTQANAEMWTLLLKVTQWITNKPRCPGLSAQCSFGSEQSARSTRTLFSTIEDGVSVGFLLLGAWQKSYRQWVVGTSENKHQGVTWVNHTVVARYNQRVNKLCFAISLFNEAVYVGFTSLCLTFLFVVTMLHRCAI
jgi:hypothetical protein